MEVHSSSANSVIAKRLWNFIRIAYFMMRKGLISKRKLIMDMNLMMKRGKLMRKTLGNLLMFHPHHHNMARGGAFGLQEYEFSCSNSPNPVFFHVSSSSSSSSKRKHHYFPCINPPIEEEEIIEECNKAVVVVPKHKVEYSSPYNNFQFGTPDLAPGDKLSPLLVPAVSPYSKIRVSNYSSDDEEIEVSSNSNQEVDNEAEEFIRRFYEQLRLQRRTQLLQYQETQYQEMLARGTG